jgi:enamine deaminase RidA (YjgF/YER057c/UK114 family)
MGNTAENTLRRMALCTFDQALEAAHAYMEDIVGKNGGVEAVRKDMEEAYGAKVTDEQVCHAMACGGAIMLMLAGSAYRAANDMHIDEVPDLKSEQDSERMARNVIERIRKLH